MSKLWTKWTVHCAIGELLGIACAAGIAFTVNSVIGEVVNLWDKLITLSAMIFAGLLEGAVLGLFQWNVLVKKFRKIPKTEWVGFTILVGVIGWVLGSIPSIFFSSKELYAESTSGGIDYSNPYISIILSISLGLLLGSIFGLFQWFSLRKYAIRSYTWITANAIGWAIGLGWIFLFASIPSENSSLAFNILMGIIAGILAGLSVGAVTGYFLDKLEINTN